MERVFAAGDVTSGETLVVKAMESGREASQRVHEYLTGLKDHQHISFYERYYKENLYDRMLEGEVDTDLPPD
jgi:glutamate synthase (NADPH/NADH) small chain